MFNRPNRTSAPPASTSTSTSLEHGSRASTQRQTPAAQRRIMQMQQSAGNRAVQQMLQGYLVQRKGAGTIQRMQIGALGLDTDNQSDEELKQALLKRWSSMLGFGETRFTKVEAEALLARLRDQLPTGVVDELEDIEDEGSDQELEDDEGWDDESPDKLPDKRLELEEQLREFNEQDEARLVSNDEQPKYVTDKLVIAQRFVTAMQEAGFHVFLSGGAAANVGLQSPREMKDLDFRIEGLDVTFAEADEAGQKVIQKINNALRVFENVNDLTTSDAMTGYTISGHLNDCEVSITRTPKVEYLARGKAKQVEVLGGFDLILDKAYSLVMRSQEPKMLSDLFDLLWVLHKTRGGVHVLGFLGQQRGEAYGAQAQHMNSRAQENVYSLDIIEQLHDTIVEMSSERTWLEKIMKYFAEKDPSNAFNPLVIMNEMLGVLKRAMKK